MRHRVVVVAVVLVFTVGTAAEEPPAAVVPVVRDAVQPHVDEHLADRQKEVLARLAGAKRYPALLKLPVRVRVCEDPWKGLAALESAGSRVVAAARRRASPLPAVLEALGDAVGREVKPADAPDVPQLQSTADVAAFLTRLVQDAAALSAEAVSAVPEAQRPATFAWPDTMLKTFGPQLPFNQQTQPLLHNDRAFCVSGARQVDWSRMTAAARTLAVLAEPKVLDALAAATRTSRPLAEPGLGVTGDVLYRADTAQGLVLIGGPGDNAYNVDGPVALILDVGGKDAYAGRVAASSGAGRPNGVVVDLAGDDTYACSRLGLATGRLGVGLLVDRAGDDTYRLAHGSGGAGLAGIGVLMDIQGDDTYVGTRYTQGVAFAGIGLLLDLAGADKHTSHSHAVGFAGPAGVGAVVDVGGDDAYQCGGKVPSGYNKPDTKPDDPAFQYTAFGLGAGMGRRVLSSDAKHHAYALAGGLGMLLDLAGNDKYTSSNFSQGCGYYFGVGLKRDLAGDDEHGAARYGHASAAHFGVGLFVDDRGRDVYASTGPTYNAGCAWDHSVCLFVEAGEDADTYRFTRSAGPGRADIHSWGAFADLGGGDRYVLKRNVGQASRGGLAVFYDHAGTDTYDLGGKHVKQPPADGVTHAAGDGGLFVDAAGEP